MNLSRGDIVEVSLCIKYKIGTDRVTLEQVMSHLNKRMQTPDYVESLLQDRKSVVIVTDDFLKQIGG